MTTRWVFTDPDTAEVGTFILNPETLGDRTKTHTVPYAQFQTLGPAMVMTQDPMQSWQFTGLVLDKDDWNFFQHWFNKTNPVVLTTDLGEQFSIVFSELDTQRSRKAGAQWFMKYTAKFYVVDVLQDI